MDLIKIYIVQSISAASNNLRLNSQQVEVVALLREIILKSENLGDDLFKMKRVTEFSKIGIRLNEIYSFLTMGKIDFFKISDKFKEHSQYLIRDLNQLLESLSPNDFKAAVNKMKGENEYTGEINIDLSKREHTTEKILIEESSVLKENLILEENESHHDSFHNFEERILKTIKPLNNLLSNLKENNINYDEVDRYARIVRTNAQLSFSKNFEVIGKMHQILAQALENIKSNTLAPEKQVVDSIRACMIVIVAVIKGKEVDITNYLNKAEELGKKIINY
jgi:hypothetical protein